MTRFSLVVSKPHPASTRNGRRLVAHESPNRMGLINPNGRVAASRPNLPCQEKPNAGGEGTSMSRVKEDLTHDSIGSAPRQAPTPTVTLPTRRSASGDGGLEALSVSNAASPT